MLTLMSSYISADCTVYRIQHRLTLYRLGWYLPCEHCVLYLFPLVYVFLVGLYVRVHDNPLYVFQFFEQYVDMLDLVSLMCLSCVKPLMTQERFRHHVVRWTSISLVVQIEQVLGYVSPYRRFMVRPIC